jgi:hypothetical protein
MKTLNFEQLIDAKEESGVNVFIICKGDEHDYLNDKHHWINNSSHNIRVARLTVDEFAVLDIGKHPKVWIFEDGVEKAQINGMPTFERLAKEIKENI